MNFVKKISWVSIIFSVLEIALGICLICLPNTTLLTFCYFVAGLIIVAGACSISNYFMFGFEPFGFMKGVAEMVIGVCCLPLAKVFASPEVFATVVGIFVVLAGLFKIQTSFDARRASAKGWWLYLIYGVMLVVFAVIMLCYPFGATSAFLIFFGVLMLIDAVWDIVTTISVNAKLGKLKKEIKKSIEE